MCTVEHVLYLVAVFLVTVCALPLPLPPPPSASSDVLEPSTTWTVPSKLLAPIAAALRPTDPSALFAATPPDQLGEQLHTSTAAAACAACIHDLDLSVGAPDKLGGPTIADHATAAIPDIADVGLSSTSATSTPPLPSQNSVSPLCPAHQALLEHYTASHTATIKVVVAVLLVFAGIFVLLALISSSTKHNKTMHELSARLTRRRRGPTARTRPPNQANNIQAATTVDNQALHRFPTLPPYESNRLPTFEQSLHSTTAPPSMVSLASQSIVTPHTA